MTVEVTSDVLRALHARGCEAWPDVGLDLATFSMRAANQLGDGPTPLIATLSCPSSGCTVDAPRASVPFELWTFWVQWNISSSPLTGLGVDAVSRHDWFFELNVDIPGAVPGRSVIAQASDIRCDSAKYFRSRPAACVFADVVPHIQYSLTDPKTQEAVDHIQCAFFPATCFPMYPLYPATTPRPAMHGRFPGPPDDALHRIPSAGMVAGDTRAAGNRAEALRACTRVGRYANPGGTSPGLPDTDYPQTGKDCDEYPFASTREGANASSIGFPLFSVRAVTAGPNRCAGSALGRYYRDDRILYENDGFFVEILDAPTGAADACDFTTDEDTAVAIAAEEVPSIGGFFGGSGPILAPDQLPEPGQTLSVDAGLDVSGIEGARVVLTGFAAFASAVQWSYEPVSDVDPGTTCSFDPPSSPVTRFSCTDNGTFRVTLTASNASGQTADSALVTLTNRAPELTVSGPASWQVFRVGTPVNLTASFSDAGGNDSHTCTVNWDDGVRESYAASSGGCNRTHTFTSAGMYTIDASVADDDGGTGNDATMVIVYDPDGGFETAGGYMNSPAGALGSAPDVAARGHFQFNPKYLPGDAGPVPSGGKFQFSLDGTTFAVDSTGFEWLVVTPDQKAAVKGVASVAGQGGFGFIAYGYNDPDRFRLIVWPLTDGPNPPARPLYDSHRGARHDLDMATPDPIAAGSLQIHQ